MGAKLFRQSISLSSSFIRRGDITNLGKVGDDRNSRGCPRLRKLNCVLRRHDHVMVVIIGSTPSWVWDLPCLLFVAIYGQNRYTKYPWLAILKHLLKRTRLSLGRVDTFDPIKLKKHVPGQYDLHKPEDVTSRNSRVLKQSAFHRVLFCPLDWSKCRDEEGEATSFENQRNFK